MIQAVAIAELDGHTVPNAYGHLPLVDLDPARPAVKDGPENDYWDHVDYIVSKANALGLLHRVPAHLGPVLARQDEGRQAAVHARRTPRPTASGWAGATRTRGIIWILGGDRAVDNDEQKEVIRAMARGLRKGDGGTHLITFHPPGGAGSSQWFHGEDWLDFNMRQNGHDAEFTGRYDQTREDYDRTPPKPVHRRRADLRGPPDLVQRQEARPLDRRRRAPAALLGPVQRRVRPHLRPSLGLADVGAGQGPDQQPADALDRGHQPARRGQMQYARRLLESRPFLTRIPDDSVIVADRVPTSVPGAGRYRFVATRDGDGTYAMVYAPVGRAFRVHMDVIKGGR